MIDSLGDRMKENYEDRCRYMLPRRVYTLIRCDGRSFHRLTKKCVKPFDFTFMSIMDATALALCKEAQGAVMGYVQSDEITVLLVDFLEEKSEAWFDANLQKIVSISASVCTAEFNKHLSKWVGFADRTAHFDARVWTVADPYEVENNLIFRQKDATRNSVQMVARSLYSHKELNGVGTSELQEMIFKKGVNWNDYPDGVKRGRMIVKVPEQGWVVEAPPIFTQDRNYLRFKIPLIFSGWKEKPTQSKERKKTGLSRGMGKGCVSA
jgi:tRNA(His) 5'-end guanylyltransferase